MNKKKDKRKHKINYEYQNLKIYREIAGYTQSEAAGFLGIPKSNLCTYEKGICEPYIDVLINMGRLYNINLDDLVGGEFASENGSHHEPTLSLKNYFPAEERIKNLEEQIKDLKDTFIKKKAK